RKGGIADHVAGFSGEWRGDHDIVALGKHAGEVARLIEAVDERIRRCGRVPLERENTHPHGMDAAGYGAANVSITNDADSLSGDLFNVELLPAARLLIA